MTIWHIYQWCKRRGVRFSSVWSIFGKVLDHAYYRIVAELPKSGPSVLNRTPRFCKRGGLRITLPTRLDYLVHVPIHCWVRREEAREEGQTKAAKGAVHPTSGQRRPSEHVSFHAGNTRGGPRVGMTPSTHGLFDFHLS